MTFKYNYELRCALNGNCGSWKVAICIGALTGVYSTPTFFYTNFNSSRFFVV